MKELVRIDKNSFLSPALSERAGKLACAMDCPSSKTGAIASVCAKSKITRDLAEIKDAKKKIMVTHVHPKGTLMENLSNFVPGSSGVEKAIKVLKPDILLCSHIHEAEGIEERIGNTKVINVGRKGKVIKI